MPLLLIIVFAIFFIIGFLIVRGIQTLFGGGSRRHQPRRHLSDLDDEDDDDVPPTFNFKW